MSLESAEVRNNSSDGSTPLWVVAEIQKLSTALEDAEAQLNVAKDRFDRLSVRLGLLRLGVDAYLDSTVWYVHRGGSRSKALVVGLDNEGWVTVRLYKKHSNKLSRSWKPLLMPEDVAPMNGEPFYPRRPPKKRRNKRETISKSIRVSWYRDEMVHAIMQRIVIYIGSEIIDDLGWGSGDYIQISEDGHDLLLTKRLDIFKGGEEAWVVRLTRSSGRAYKIRFGWADTWAVSIPLSTSGAYTLDDEGLRLSAFNRHKPLKKACRPSFKKKEHTK